MRAAHVVPPRRSGRSASSGRCRAGGAPARQPSAVASRSAGPTRACSALRLTRAAAPRSPMRVQRQGVSTSCVSATCSAVVGHAEGARSRSSGGSSGSRHDHSARKRPCSSRGPFRSSTRARWKNPAAISSPVGSSPRSTFSQAERVVGDVVAEAELASRRSSRAPSVRGARRLPGSRDGAPHDTREMDERRLRIVARRRPRRRTAVVAAQAVRPAAA